MRTCDLVTVHSCAVVGCRACTQCELVPNSGCEAVSMMACEEVCLGHHVCLRVDLRVVSDPMSQGVSVLAFPVLGVCVPCVKCGICLQYGGSRDVVVVAFGMWCVCGLVSLVVYGFYVVCVYGMCVVHIWVCHEYVYIGYVVDM